MKNVLLTLIMVMSIAVSANAIENCSIQNLPTSSNVLSFSDVNMGVVFRTNQNLCCGKDQMILYKSGRFELYQDSVELYSGTYSVDAENHVVVLDVDGTNFRCKYTLKQDGQNIQSLTFRTDRFTPCNR